MNRNYVSIAFGIVCISVLIGSCKDEGQPTGSSAPPPGSLLTASPPGVTVGTGGSQNVTITGGTHPYTAQVQNPAFATTQFVTNNDTAVVRITGVSTATGVTSVVVRDASTPQPKSVGVTITKTQ